MRESLEFRTAASQVCSTCHATFAPFGYSLMPFDPVGRWVTEDPSGKPWDLSGSVPAYAGEPISFTSPHELVSDLASHPQLLGCFAQVALEWAFGRALLPEDQTLVVGLNDVSQGSNGNVASVLKAIVMSPDFVSAVAPR